MSTSAQWNDGPSSFASLLRISRRMKSCRTRSLKSAMRLRPSRFVSHSPSWNTPRESSVSNTLRANASSLIRQPIFPRSTDPDARFAVARKAITSSDVPFCDIHRQLEVSSFDCFATTLHENGPATPATFPSATATAGLCRPAASAEGK